jgi:hypothetical protein
MMQCPSLLEAANVSAPCEVCRKVMRMRPVYEGRYVKTHDAIVCNHCWASNRNGWRAEHEEQMLGSNATRLSIGEIEEQRRAVKEGSNIKVA